MMPKQPKVKELPAPSRTDAEIQQAAETQRRALAAETLTDNWATGGLGVRNKKLTTSAAQLLGG